MDGKFIRSISATAGKTPAVESLRLLVCFTVAAGFLMVQVHIKVAGCSICPRPFLQLNKELSFLPTTKKYLFLLSAHRDEPKAV